MFSNFDIVPALKLTPRWNIKIQVVPEKDAAKFPFNPFDLMNDFEINNASSRR